ncbi:oxygenase MpaB family protein [Mycobacterium sp. CPCC 205372]|uniref:Oxygenase MpaB family protein n=1 Tax=Mycobacterium hippophais TaxID=3016340 RepID=A0ABT4PS30_9MYCO|nr:oxygenase MpaB family protein [Mycobacterium hippophais]MCZ8379372.1 oxygenase MpaB family protein [Mycobacterium hippophais]
MAGAELSEDEIEALNFVGDPLSEDFLLAAKAAGLDREDDFAALSTLRAAGDSAAEALWRNINHVPSFLDFEAMRMVAGFNRRNFFAGPYFVAGALPFTYADPNVAHVLDFGGGLRRNGGQVKRFRETLRGVTSVNDVEALKPGGRAWEQWVRIRLIHSRVRMGISRTAEWDYRVGVPVSALRIAGGSYVFASFVPQVYLSVGATASAQEIEAITRVWQWITYLLGGPLEFLLGDLDEQEVVNRKLLEHTMITSSDPVGTRLAHEWFLCCARDGILGVRVPLPFVHALARRAVIGGLPREPGFAAAVIDYLQIPRHPVADRFVTIMTVFMRALARCGRWRPVRNIFELVGEALTSRLIRRLE